MTKYYIANTDRMEVRKQRRPSNCINLRRDFSVTSEDSKVENSVVKQL